VFSQEFDIPVVGIPGTIDNDMYGTDYTIGFDTCLNTVMEAVDKIRDTASSHDRIFFVEVMGREAGFVALQSGIASGVEAILIPEVKGQIDNLVDLLAKPERKNKSSIIFVAEGHTEGNTYEIAEKVGKTFPDLDIRVTILGHIQRGGSPTAYDRITASRMGVAAVEALIDDQKSIMIGIANGEIVHVPLSKTVKLHKEVPQSMLDVAKILV
jgi:6-phosphofructokinase 1